MRRTAIKTGLPATFVLLSFHIHGEKKRFEKRALFTFCIWVATSRWLAMMLIYIAWPGRPPQRAQHVNWSETFPRCAAFKNRKSFRVRLMAMFMWHERWLISATVPHSRRCTSLPLVDVDSFTDDADSPTSQFTCRSLKIARKPTQPIDNNKRQQIASSAKEFSSSKLMSDFLLMPSANQEL